MATSFSASTESALLHASLTWTIDNFSLRNTGVGSPAFYDEKKNEFHLAFNPDVDGFVFLTITMVAKQSVKIKYKLSLVNLHGQSRLLYDQTESLEPHPELPVVGMGIPKLISRADLLEPSNGYLPNDALTLHFEIEHLDNENKSTLSAFPSQADTMAKIFDTLRNDYGSFLKNDTLADVKLIVGGNPFPAHKVILAARSSVFAAMFTHDTKEKMENQVEILDIEPEAFEKFLSFLYTGAIPTFDGIKSTEELLIAADKYGSEQLKTICEDYLISQLSLETAPNLLLLANSVNADKLKKKAIGFMRGRGSELFDALQNEPDQLVNLFQGLAEKNQEKEQSK